MVKRLHDAFKPAVEEESHITPLKRCSMVPISMRSAACLKFAQDTNATKKAQVETLGRARPL